MTLFFTFYIKYKSSKKDNVPLPKSSQSFHIQSAIAFIVCMTTLLSGALATETERKSDHDHSCLQLYLRPFHDLSFEELTSIRTDFKHNTNYSTEIKTTPVRDQCDYGSCWIYATIAELEHQLLNQEKNEDISEQYLIIHSLIEKSFNALKTPGEIIKTGGNMLKATDLIQRYGLVPSSAWKPKLSFERSPLSNRLLDFLNGRISRFQIDNSNETSRSKKIDLLEKAQSDVLSIILSFSGPLPEKFTYEGKEYTPLEWKNSYIGEDFLKWRRISPTQTHLPEELKKIAQKRMIVSSNKSPKPIANYSESEVRSFEEIEKLIISELKKGRIVPVSVEMAHSFIDKKSGIMSLSAFHLPESFSPPTRAFRKAFDVRGKLKGTDHMMDIVGADVDDQGKIIKFKLRNSHGEETGDGGYYHLYSDYFENYLNYIVIRH